ncbi:MAG TPA: NUDIX hydrolase [Armatimonadota bacterium]
MPDREFPELREETISSERQFEGKLLQVRVDQVRLPDGREARREIVEHVPAIAAVPLRPDGQVLLVRQWRHPAGEALLEVPAGCLEPGESPDECVNRELAEEIGYRADRIERLFSLYLAPGYSQEIIHYYLAQDLQPASAEADEDENLQIVTLPLAEAVRLCLAGEIRDAKSVAALLAVAIRLGLTC